MKVNRYVNGWQQTDGVDAGEQGFTMASHCEFCSLILYQVASRKASNTLGAGVRQMG